MRIIHLINNMARGGAEKRVLDLINRSDPNIGLALACLNLNDSALISQIERSDLVLFDLGVFNHDDLLGGASRLAEAFQSFKPEVLHTHLVQASLVGRIASLASRVPVVVSTQHHAFHIKEDTFLYSLERATWRLSDGFIALSSSIKRKLRTCYRGPIRVIPTGIDPETMAAPSRQPPIRGPFILSVGQFRDGQKGHDLLVEAFARITGEFPQHSLVLVGDGPERPKVQAIVDKRGLTDRIVFLGERDDVASLMAAADLFVLSSRWEGFGRVILEAMTSGLPVVATEVEGIPELISHNKDGLLVPAANTVQLAHSLALLLGDAQLRRRLGRNARQAVQRKFDLQNMIDDEYDFYHDLLKRCKYRMR